MAVTLDVEVAYKGNLDVAACRKELEAYLNDNYISLAQDTRLVCNVWPVERVQITSSSGSILRLADVKLRIHMYALRDAFEDIAHDGEVLGTLIALPAASLDGLWGTLLLEPSVQPMLLNYVASMMLFADKAVDPQVCSFNRCMLLHGPPGSGKTSLCKALAHKVSVRFGSRYSNPLLFEVHAASLFSKYFSESSKLVVHLFDDIYKMTYERGAFVCVLIDEIESLTRSRTRSSESNDPSDTMRVVNVLLTQLDRLKQRPNVLILTTSNMADASDSAFLDRADLVQYIGNPGLSAAYDILKSCLDELMDKGVVQSPVVPSQEANGIPQFAWADKGPLVCFAEALGQSHGASVQLLNICRLFLSQREIEASGRGLRRLALLAHARFIQRSEPCSLAEMLSALERAAQC